MKKTTLLLLLCSLLFCATYAQQDGEFNDYSYTFIRKGPRTFTVGLVPGFTNASTGGRLTQFLVFIKLPKDIRIDTNSFLKQTIAVDADEVKYIDQNSYDMVIIPSLALKDYVIPSATQGEVIDLFTFDITGEVASGTISLSENGDAPANARPDGSLSNALNADTSGAQNSQDEYIGNTGTTSYELSSTTLSTPDLTENVLQISPNPSKGVFTVSLPRAAREATVKIFDATGRQVVSGKPKGLDGRFQIQASQLPNGIYVLELESNSQRYMEKLIIKQ